MKYDFYIGIDPGTTTGIAVWNKKENKFDHIYSCGILEAMERLQVYAVFGNNLFVIENPNLRKWFGNSGREKLQGAGSIKRDYSIWLEWFERTGCTYEAIAPKNVTTKLDAKSFMKITGYTERTNSHSRDAAMMVFKR